MRVRVAVAVCLLSWMPWVSAAHQDPLYKLTNDLGWSLDKVVDTTSLGTATGVDLALTGTAAVGCDQQTNGGALTTDSAGLIYCTADDGGAGGSTNSFQTIAVPAGTNPVADSSTDTLTLTETSFLTITGTAGTDTIDITQVTTDLGTDGLIAANAVALGTDTTNAYLADGAGTANEIEVSGGGSETATLTIGIVDNPDFDGDPTITDASPSLTWNTASTDWGLHADPSGTSFFLSTGTVKPVIVDDNGQVAIPDLSASACDVKGTAGTGALYCGTDATAAGGSGDVTDVGDCATGACFTGASGTTLTSSDGTLTSAGDLEASDGSPTVLLTDTTASEDDYEVVANESQVAIGNTTDAQSLVTIDNNQGFADLRVGENGLTGRFQLVNTNGYETLFRTGTQTGNIDYTLPTSISITNIGTGSAAANLLATTSTGTLSWNLVSSDFGAMGFNTDAQSVGSGTDTPIVLDDADIYDVSYNNFQMHYTSDANLTGTVEKTASSATITGTGTLFLTELGLGQIISIPGTATETCGVIAIASQTSLTCSLNMQNNATGQTATRQSEYMMAPVAGRYLFVIVVPYQGGGSASQKGVIFCSFTNSTTCTIRNRTDSDAGTTSANSGIFLLAFYDASQYEIFRYDFNQGSGGNRNIGDQSGNETRIAMELIHQ